MSALPTVAPAPRRPRRPGVAVPRLRIVPSPRDARRAPFVALVLLVVCGGLIALLILNTAIAADSFTRGALSDRSESLRLQVQQLEQEVNAAQSPQALARAAVGLGMIPNSTAAFLVLHPDGSTEVLGAAQPAAVPPAPASAQSAPAAQPVPEPDPAAQPAPEPAPAPQPAPAAVPPADPPATGGTG